MVIELPAGESHRAHPPKASCDTHTRLLRAAIDLIWEHSYGAVSVNDICERAGVHKGSFYHFFTSKSELAVAAYEQHWRDSLPGLERCFAADVAPLDRIRRYCALWVTTQRDRKARIGKVCGCPFASLGSEQSTQDERLRGLTRDILARQVAFLERALEEAVARREIETQDCAQAARDMAAFARGLVLQAKIDNDIDGLASLEAGVFRFIRGRVPPPAAQPVTATRTGTERGGKR